MEKNLIKELKIDDLPEPYKLIADSCGVETAIKIAELFGGSQVTFQKLDTILYVLKERLIRSQFNGYNYSELARKYNCSTSWVRKITADSVERERSRPIENQISLFSG